MELATIYSQYEKEGIGMVNMWNAKKYFAFNKSQS